MNPKISIIIPVYNAEKFISKCLDSAINQTYKNIEIICVNDGSKDNSLKILEEYSAKDSRVVIVNKQNAGVSEARNDGIKNSTGEYIAFLDSDDWLERDAIGNLFEALVENKVDVVRGAYYINEGNKEYLGVQIDEAILNRCVSTEEKDFCQKVICEILNGNMPGYIWLLLIKKESVLKTPLFQKEIPVMEDTVFYCDLMNVIDKIYFLNKPTYHYFCNEEGCVNSKNNYIKKIKSFLKVREYLLNQIERDKFEKHKRIDIVNTNMANLIANHAFMAFATGDKKLQTETKQLMQSEEVKNAMKNVNTRNLPWHLAIHITFIKKNRKKSLILYYKLRKIIRKMMFWKK
ncbi:MAG: glycosyltransferase family 2 protein [Clostridia bacterium]|nr:glycosyltransferase family 2 protein [Clostridia bacterium]